MRDLEASIEEQRTAQGIDHNGARIVKTFADLERYRVILDRVQPAWVVDVGTHVGGSATWFADAGPCRVITIDTHAQVAPETHGHPSVTWLIGDSLNEADKVARIIGHDQPVIVVLDSDHSAEHVYQEMVLYAPLVTVGSYLCVEDTIVEWIPEQLAVYKNSSPLQAVQRFLAEHPDEWLIDQELEDMLPTTQSPMGWLRRR